MTKQSIDRALERFRAGKQPTWGEYKEQGVKSHPEDVQNPYKTRLLLRGARVKAFWSFGEDVHDLYGPHGYKPPWAGVGEPATPQT